MSINRILMKSQSTDVGNAFIMTMGQQGYQYGYSRYNATIGDAEGSVQHEGKAVTLVMLCYYSGYLDFAFNVEGVSGGRYNVTVKVTSTETNTSVTIQFPNIQYQSYVPGFYEYTQDITSDAVRMFSKANVGKQYKVELIFN
ncbi:hypothetical protein [Phascolarctobacterium succinatutens]|uniref:hypothetical protein n=1 Tax=Phascolarctobacterium succinatutens TaxID=626940 RepID=UPI003F7DA8DE